MPSWVIYTLIAQVVIAVFVFFVLKKILDNMLLEAAVRQLEFWAQSVDPNVKNPFSSSSPDKTFLKQTITVVSPAKIKTVYYSRIIKVAKKICGENANPVFSFDPGLLGGVVIRIGEKEFEYSLRQRLRQAMNAR